MSANFECQGLPDRPDENAQNTPPPKQSTLGEFGIRIDSHIQMLKNCCTDNLYKLITKSDRKRALRRLSVHNDYCKRKESHGTSQLAMLSYIKKPLEIPVGTSTGKKTKPTMRQLWENIKILLKPAGMALQRGDKAASMAGASPGARSCKKGPAHGAALSPARNP